MSAASSAPVSPPDLADRVAAFVSEQQLLNPGEPCLVLVSGGADSMCAWGLMRELGHEAEALHVEHGLRGRHGLDDAAYCAAAGATVVPVDVEPGGNLEARARDARYRAAAGHAAGRPVVTGHTLSDQAETVVYRLASSSGPRAIRAMRPAAGGVVRPLLCVTAAETRAWCAGRGLEPRRDETNDDRSLRRNLIRHEVMPALLRVHPGAEVNLARSAELLAELHQLVSELAAEHVADEIDLERIASLPRALRVLVLREAAERAAGRPLRLPRQLTGRLEELAGRRGGVERLSLAADLEAVRDRSRLRFSAPRYSGVG
jgi:tRNA(Ile)-lysidine synthase